MQGLVQITLSCCCLGIQNNLPTPACEKYPLPGTIRRIPSIHVFPNGCLRSSIHHQSDRLPIVQSVAIPKSSYALKEFLRVHSCFVWCSRHGYTIHLSCCHCIDYPLLDLYHNLLYYQASVRNRTCQTASSSEIPSLLMRSGCGLPGRAWPFPAPAPRRAPRSGAPRQPRPYPRSMPSRRPRRSAARRGSPRP